jgi:predicted SprT family Zn-dependent metalloprotease
MVSKNKLILFIAVLQVAMATSSWAEDIDTNEVAIPAAPSWLTSSRVDKVVEHVQNKLEWDVRKINVKFYTDEAQFEKLHGFGSSVLAFSQKNTLTIAMGPRINTTNFDAIFGHELTHMILYQKYKTAIPGWLEEGLADYIGQNSKVDYVWLAAQEHPDVRTMSHPFKAQVQSPRYQYQASTAVIEMLAAKCGLDDLLQLSVGSNLEHYFATFCGIPDINQAFKEWVQMKAQRQAAPPSGHP